MSGMMFEKEGRKKKRHKKKYSGSRIPGDQKGRCYICGRYTQTENHHIFFGKGNRILSDDYGLTVFLCPECHKEGKKSVHKCEDTRRKLEEIGKEVFLDQIGTEEDFKRIFIGIYQPGKD